MCFYAPCLTGCLLWFCCLSALADESRLNNELRLQEMNRQEILRRQSRTIVVCIKGVHNTLPQPQSESLEREWGIEGAAVPLTK